MDALPNASDVLSETSVAREEHFECETPCLLTFELNRDHDILLRLLKSFVILVSVNEAFESIVPFGFPLASEQPPNSMSEASSQ